MGDQCRCAAIFAVSSDGRDGLVNFGVRGPYTVVEELAPSFMLRSGKLVATVTNQTTAQPRKRGGKSR